MPNMHLYQCDTCVVPGESLPCYMLGNLDEDYKTMPCQSDNIGDHKVNWVDKGEHVCLPVEEYEKRIREAQARAVVWAAKSPHIMRHSYDYILKKAAKELNT